MGTEWDLPVTVVSHFIGSVWGWDKQRNNTSLQLLATEHNSINSGVECLTCPNMSLQ